MARIKKMLVVTLTLLTTGVNSHVFLNPRLDSQCGGGHYICDEQGILSRDTYLSIDEELRALEKDYPISCGASARGYQVGILVAGTPVLTTSEQIGSYAKSVFNSWKLGHKPCDNGVILVVAISERKTSIKTGKGARRVVTDRFAADILSSSKFKNALRNEQYDKAVEHAVRELTAVLKTNDSGMYYKLCDMWDQYWHIALLAILAVLVSAIGAYWCFEAEKKRRRRAEFERKLRNLAEAREKLSKRSGDVRQAPCAICFELLGTCDFKRSNTSGDAELLKCGHVFHIDCIGRWLAKNKTCPICRVSKPRIDGKNNNNETKRGTSGTSSQPSSSCSSMPRVAEPTPEYWSDMSERLFEDYQDYAEVQHMPRGGDRDWLTDYQVAQFEVLQQAQAAEASTSWKSSDLPDSGGDWDFGGGDCDDGGGADDGW
jgi:uncharacterized membrane protein YgcG